MLAKISVVLLIAPAMFVLTQGIPVFQECLDVQDGDNDVVLCDSKTSVHDRQGHTIATSFFHNDTVDIGLLVEMDTHCMLIRSNEKPEGISGQIEANYVGVEVSKDLEQEVMRLTKGKCTGHEVLELVPADPDSEKERKKRGVCSHYHCYYHYYHYNGKLYAAYRCYCINYGK